MAWKTHVICVTKNKVLQRLLLLVQTSMTLLTRMLIGLLDIIIFIPHSKNIVPHNTIWKHKFSHTSLYQVLLSIDIHPHFDTFLPPTDTDVPIKWMITFHIVEASCLVALTYIFTECLCNFFLFLPNIIFIEIHTVKWNGSPWSLNFMQNVWRNNFFNRF